MAVPTYIPDHVAQGLALLTSMYREQPNVTGLLAGYLRRLQGLEDAIADFLFKIQLGNHPLPGGPWDILDKLASIVGAPLRNGMTDAQYVPVIQIQIRVNRSNGLAEDIIQIAALIVTGAVYREFYPASWDLTVLGATDAQIAALTSVLTQATSYLKQAKQAGTLGVVRYSDWSAPTGVWITSSNVGTVPAATGLKDSVSGQFPDAPVSVAQV
jgi:hypothetical protein